MGFEVEKTVNDKKYEVGEILEGKVTGVAKFGAFVDIGKEKTGLVHISEISNTYVKEVGDYVKEGQTVKVKILGINDKGKIELSIKQAETAPKPVTSFSPKRESFSGAKSVSSGNKFEEMIMKFKKLSDEKLGEFKEKTKFRRGKSSHKGDI